MSWPKHKWGWIVLGPWGAPIADNGQGMFVEMSYAEVFLERRAAVWVKRKQQKFLREFGAIQKPEQRVKYEEGANRVRIVRIALPGTYAQFQIPGLIERHQARERRAERATADAKEGAK
jgi:hypothetical protein